MIAAVTRNLNVITWGHMVCFSNQEKEMDS